MRRIRITIMALFGIVLIAVGMTAGYATNSGWQNSLTLAPAQDDTINIYDFSHNRSTIEIQEGTIFGVKLSSWSFEGDLNLYLTDGLKIIYHERKINSDFIIDFLLSPYFLEDMWLIEATGNGAQSISAISSYDNSIEFNMTAIVND
jgi:hypothetical protein